MRDPESPCEARKAFFDERAASWLDTFYRDPVTGAYTLHKDKFERFMSLVEIREGERVLDVGCGTGVLVPYILDRVGKQGRVYELDYAPNMIEINRKLHPDERIRFLLCDVTEIPLEAEHCDVVLCFACFPHFDDKEKALRSLTRVLKEKGILCIVHFDSSEGINDHHRKAGTPVMHDRLPEIDEMKGLFLCAGLEAIRFMDEPGFYFVSGRKPY
ncbi:MAG: class I SAM-dependent methyltransferase [Deltaproteobacteria bacterium]|nr:class I SAM-dependent methyltransferase [Deltaproteobacteria bacterium]